MSHSTYKSVYNGLVLPALRGGFHVLSLASPKVREGLQGRRGLTNRIAAFRNEYPTNRIILFHCASAGELQALKPFARAFAGDNVKLAVSFFSPSARAALEKDNPFDFADYSPPDVLTEVENYIGALRPDVIAITKHDVWPNFVWTARKLGIPIFLMNGNFHAGSIKQLPGMRFLHSPVYSAFTEIMVVSGDDARNARRLAGKDVNVNVSGDSRFDQVVSRVTQSAPLPTELESVCAGKKVLVAGSTHDVDEELIIPVIARLSKTRTDLLTLFIPHDPSQDAKNRIQALAERFGIAVADLDDGLPLTGSSIVLVNRTGILADLYRLGRVAYVGGGFGKGVHSVLEPLVYGLPVITGPHIGVSYEARAGAALGIVSVVRGRRTFEDQVRRWMDDDTAWRELGRTADRFVQQHSGATDRITRRLREALNERT